MKDKQRLLSSSFPRYSMRSSGLSSIPKVPSTLSNDNDLPVLSFYSRILDDTLTYPQHEYGIFFFTVVIIDRQQSETEQALYLSLTRNWILSVNRAFPLPSFGTSSTSTTNVTAMTTVIPLIIAIDEFTCERIQSLNLQAHCEVDTITLSSVPLVNRVDPVAGNTVVLYKYIWTQQALTRGYRVLYSDIDIVFQPKTKNKPNRDDGNNNNEYCHPLQYLITEKLRGTTSDSSTNTFIPDIQFLSDHSSVTDPHECSASYQCTIAYLMALRYQDWSVSTYDKLYPYDNLMCFLINNGHYPSSSTCVSTAFWFVEASLASLAFFNDMLTSLASLNEWEQRLLNRILPHHLDMNTLSVHILDPLVMGNIDNIQCGRYVHTRLQSTEEENTVEDMCRAFTTDGDARYHHTYPSEWVSTINKNYRNARRQLLMPSSSSSLKIPYDSKFNFSWDIFGTLPPTDNTCSLEKIVQQPILLHAGYYKGIDSKIKALQDNGGWFIV